MFRARGEGGGHAQVALLTGGTIIVEAEEATDAESFPRGWDVGETTVTQLTEMPVG